jgi:outer membrane autotransporter protein
MLWSAVLVTMTTMTSVGYADTTATVNTTNTTGAGSLSTAVTAINADTSGGTINFDISGGGTIAYDTSVNVTKPVSFLNSSSASSNAVTVDLGTGSLDASKARTVSLGSNVTWLSSTSALYYSTNPLTITSLAGTLEATASSGKVYGIRCFGNANLTITDFTGNITATFTGPVSTTGADEAFGICAYTTTFNNGFAGTISAKSTGTFSYGILADNGMTVNGNLGGTITVTTLTSNYSFARGIAAYGDGDNDKLTVNGDVSGDISVSGCFSYGITSSKVVINGTVTGKIDTLGRYDSVGIAADTVSITNGVSGTISATSTEGWAEGISGRSGINGGSTDKALVVSGTVEATGTQASAIESYNTINLKVSSTGTLSAVATVANETGYAINALYDETAGPYDSKIELEAGCKIVGAISLKSGTADVLTLSGSTGSTTLNGDITEAETINVTGGTWTTNGAITGCNTLDISGGSISLNGQTSGNVTVESAGTLYGTGLLTGNLANYGTVAPGNSIGTLSVSGNFVNKSSGTLQIEIKNTGSSDKLAVGGTASLAGTVSVLGGSGVYTSGTTYRFLTAADGISGSFDSVVDDMAFYHTWLLYGTNYVDILLASNGTMYDSIAITGNQHGVARYLDAQASGASGDFATVLSNIDSLSASGARAAYDAMSGEIHGSLTTIGIENNDRFLRSIANHMRVQSMTQGSDFASTDANGGSVVYVNRLTSSFDNLANKMSGWTTWFDSYGVGASIAGNGNASGLSYSTGGMTVGMERHLDEHTLLGFGGGYTASSTTLDNRSDWGSIDGGNFSVYVHRDQDTHYLTGIVAYGYNSYSTKRHIDFGSIDRTANADYSGNNYSAYAEIGRNLRGRFANLQPFAGLEYVGVQQNSFNETNADSIDLAVKDSTTNAMRGLLGTRILNYYRTKSGRLLTLDASAAWRHEFLNENAIVDASFAGQTGGTFAVTGNNVDRDAAIVGAGLNYAMSDHCSVYANYDLLFSKDDAAHSGLGGLQYAW